MLNKSNVTAYNKGLGEKEEIVSYESGRNSNKGTGRIHSKGKDKINLIKLDDLKLKNINLIKIDVEGYNIKVLNGMKKTIKENRPDLFIECDSRSEKKKVEESLKKLGYFIDKKIIFNATPTYKFSREKNTGNSLKVIFQENMFWTITFIRRKIIGLR